MVDDVALAPSLPTLASISRANMSSVRCAALEAHILRHVVAEDQAAQRGFDRAAVGLALPPAR